MARDTVIVWCAPRMVDTPFAQCLSALQQHDKDSDRVLDVLGLISSPLVADARNHLTRAALATDADWVLYLDADMAFPADTLDRLHEAADRDTHPFVSGLYFGGKPEGPAIPHAYVAQDSESSFAPVEGVNQRGEFSGLGEVNMVGAGCMLVHRTALEKIAETFGPTGMPWFANAVRDGESIGEDVVFCMRANAVGVPIFCLFDLTLGHIKTGIVDERTHRQYLKLLDQGWTEEQVNEDWGSRFRYAGFRSFGDMNAEVVEKVPLTVESLLGADGQRAKVE